MADLHPIAAVRVTVDSPIARGPVLFWGYAVLPTASWSFALRDGQNASAPMLFEVGDAASVGGATPFVHPIPFDNGMFADLGAGLTSVTIFYEPVREEMLGPRAEEPASVETE